MQGFTDEDFQRLHTYIRKCFGIDLHNKKQLIVSRLSNTVTAEGFDGFHDYVEEILRGQNKELISGMLNKLTTNYTYFLREKEHFDFLQNIILPELEKRHQGDKCLSIWSAGCSSGEEPYTISMYLKEYFARKQGNWDLRILATDISQNILNSAMNPVYGMDSISKLPPAWQSKYFVKKPDGNLTISPDIRNNVIFRPFNLLDTPHWKRPFDLIFCRNVMIYFDQPTKDALVNRFYQVTVPGGWFFIGHSEGLTKQTCPYAYIEPAIYQKK
ncbi:MAG: protein-glutamate O-methyltransferase CheR [Bacillota bacterium]|uniref:protein-glutamate O-methyltransferase n=1 Tax=[Clostridium] aminophilum TaxID=1526 RepID=A0A1I6IV40_9FIRM|nr:protein-glutamate O-methyltransferase CheR [[Clostridium] aminophilum]MCR4629048.1 protein-glutamate O-methyltransferase CheR [Clostridium sp.]MDT3844612.1 protein-glutamate O-methyltransferase CheR [Bacillota bacterium]SFR70541.1 chemotaxis protein methyltransferase CheR [[Clostridium] aminophilum]